MKKTTAFLAVAALAISFTNTSFAQNQNQTKTIQQQTQPNQNQQRTVQPGGGQNQLLVQPGFRQPAPRLGFNGQMIHGYGMKVASVNWGSAAQRAGLESGDVIMKVNGRAIRSQWDYDQALRDAANFNYGQVNMKVRNVRYDWGHNVPMFAYVSTVLDGFASPIVPASPVGPMGPRSQQNMPQQQQQQGHSVALHRHR